MESFTSLLLAAKQGDITAKEQLLQDFDRLLTWTASRAYYDKEDCKQILSISFLNAIEHFDISKVLTAFKEKRNNGL